MATLLCDGVRQHIDPYTNPEVPLSLALRFSTEAVSHVHGEDLREPVVDLMGTDTNDGCTLCNRSRHEASCQCKRPKIRLTGHLTGRRVIPTFTIRNDLIVHGQSINCHESHP